MSDFRTMGWTEVSNSLDPDEEIVVLIGGQGASRSSLAHLLAGHDSLFVVDSDRTPNVGPPRVQIGAIALAVERTIQERERLGARPRRAIFVGQSKGVSMGRALASSRPDLFKGGIGVGGACRNLRDIKAETRVLMEFVAKSQMAMLDGEADEAALQTEWNEFAEMAERPLDASQFFVSIYVGEDGDEVFKEENCVSSDPHHLNIPVSPPDAATIARILTDPALARRIDPLGLGPASPWVLNIQRQLLASPAAEWFLSQMLQASRSARVCVPRTTLRRNALECSELVSQRIPINHSLIGFSDSTLAAARRGIELLRAWPDDRPQR